MEIGKQQNLSTTVDGLRRHAEETLHLTMTEPRPPRTEEGLQRLVHELEVHKIELEMQNAELRQARDEVENALEKYTDLYDFAPVGYFTLDRSGDITAVNLCGARILGIERSRLLGRRFGLHVADEARPHFTAFLEKVFARQSAESCELKLAPTAHPPLIVQVEALVCASGGECRVAVIDITGRRHAEEGLSEKREELEELNKSLEGRIAGAVDELRQKDQLLILQERLAIIGEMINNIAHQWRQPLNTLGLIIQKLPIFYGTAEFSRRFLDENTDLAMKLITQMSRTIDDFRDFFRSDKELVTFSVNGVIKHMITLIEMSFLNQRIRIDYHAEGEPMVAGYPNEYAQVLLNVLMNARDVLVGENVGEPLISIRAFTEGGRTVVTITDNGGGIADGIIDRIFDPYFTTKGPDNGTGIGLFMSKTIIDKNMGGRLTVRNAGNGAVFRIEVKNGGS
ncbi:MAG: ATP-binding protein [Desulfuromonadaceae bacterium]